MNTCRTLLIRLNRIGRDEDEGEEEEAQLTAWRLLGSTGLTQEPEHLSVRKPKKIV